MKVPKKRRMSEEEIAKRYDKLVRKTYEEIVKIVGAQAGYPDVNALEGSGLISLGIFTFMAGLIELHTRITKAFIEKALKEIKEGEGRK